MSTFVDLLILPKRVKNAIVETSRIEMEFTRDDIYEEIHKFITQIAQAEVTVHLPNSGNEALLKYGKAIVQKSWERYEEMLDLSYAEKIFEHLDIDVKYARKYDETEDNDGDESEASEEDEYSADIIGGSISERVIMNKIGKVLLTIGRGLMEYCRKVDAKELQKKIGRQVTENAITNATEKMAMEFEMENSDDVVEESIGSLKRENDEMKKMMEAMSKKIESLSSSKDSRGAKKQQSKKNGSASLKNKKKQEQKKKKSKAQRGRSMERDSGKDSSKGRSKSRNEKRRTKKKGDK